MDLIVRAITLVLIPLAANGVITLLRRPKQAQAGEVRAPIFIGILGVVCFLLCMIPTVITFVQDEPLAVPIIFLAFALLGMALLFAFINCRIWYDEEGFTVRNFFGVKRRYTYDQLVGIREARDTHLMIGKRQIMVEEIFVGREEFVTHLKEEYRRRNNGKAIPEIQKLKFDLFNGNLKSPHEALFVIIFLGVLLLAFLGFAVWATFVSSSSPENTLERQVTFYHYETTGKDILIRGTDSQLYRIRSTDEAFDAQKIKALCDQRATVTVYVDQVTPEEGDDYFLLKAVLQDGKYVLTFEETTRFHRAENRQLLWIMLAAAAIFAAYAAGTVVVGRNPKKFSKRIVRLFFKDEALR